jgi:hypothetical protein
MNHAHEYALLAAVAIPFLAVAGMNAYLWWQGERGTLLVPSAEPFAPMPEACEARATGEAGTAPAEAANDERVLEAA